MPPGCAIEILTAYDGVAGLLRRVLYCELGTDNRLRRSFCECEGYKMREKLGEVSSKLTSGVVRRERRLPRESRQDPAVEYPAAKVTHVLKTQYGKEMMPDFKRESRSYLNMQADATILTLALCMASLINSGSAPTI